MKKVLLTTAAVVAMFVSMNAQCSNEKTTTSYFDDFTDATGPTGSDNSGAYEWGTPTLTNGHQSTVSRTGGVLDATVTQAQDGYEPFGISFGDTQGDGSGTKYTVDLSSDASFSVDFTNNSTTVTVKCRMVLQDASGNLVDTYASANGTWNAPWDHTIEVIVAPGETKTLSGTYAGGYYADYGSSTLTTNLDFTKVTGLNFTIVNNANTGDPLYQSLSMTDVNVEIDNIELGACTVNALETAAAADITLFPNPASDVVSVSADADALVISDVLGNVVAEGEGSSASVAGLASGVYFAGVVVDGATVATKKFVVE